MLTNLLASIVVPLVTNQVDSVALLPKTNNGVVELTVTNRPSKTIEWQYDGIRERIKKYIAQEACAKEFNRTNTDPQLNAAVEGLMFQCNISTNDIEMGYRSDGVVVWRKVPEAIRVGY